MKAAELFCEYSDSRIPDIEILTLTESAANADCHAVFVCIRGAHKDGHDFASEAYRRGCRVFVAERELPLPPEACVILQPDTKIALSLLACRFYGNPSHKMHLIGITGTKGKTTTAQLLAHILNTNGSPCGYIGTNGIQYGNIQQSLTNTTPDAITLQSALKQMYEAGIHTAAVEVSSQALLRHRAAGVRFETVLFTNLSPDHIGPLEHPNFENYKDCKHRLFTDFGAQNAVYNSDDPAAAQMLAGTSAVNCIACSAVEKTDLYAFDIRLLRDKKNMGVAFTISDGAQALPATLPLTGKMNAGNALLAIATATKCFGISLESAVNALSEATVMGRSEVIPLPNGACAVIDYAHNSASMRQLLSTLREYRPTRLIALFGSIGERAQMRRAELGKVAAELCDLCILTSDNPGNEPPEAITAEIAKAFVGSSTPYLEISDRAAAIRTAAELTRSGDILVLAGKGHETYQLIRDKKIPFCEREILAEAVKECIKS